jgi:drug/metabolite transporter (DMT)-like permease
MSPELLIAVGAGVGGMLGWGLADFFVKKTVDEVGDVVSAVWAHVFGTVALVIFASWYYFFQQVPLPSLSGFVVSALLFFGALQAAVYLFVYVGFAKGQVAVLSPIFASFAGLVALVSILFLGESVSGSVVLVLATIFVGVILCSIDIHATIRGSFLAAPGVTEVVAATFLAAVWTLLWDSFVEGADWVAFTVLMYAFMTACMYLYARARHISLRIDAQKNHVWKYLALIGVCEIVAYLAISYGYSATSLTSVVAILSGAFSLPVIILARLFLHERPTRMQSIGSIVVILGVILLPLA